MESRGGVETPELQVQREVQINDLIATSRCSHMLQYRGHGSRRIERSTNGNLFEQHTVFLYQDFAAYGDLAKLIVDHQERNK